MEENGTNNSLVEFVSMATSNLKHTLGRPMKPKRKVNHRKYLQRQLKCRSGGGFTQSASTLFRPIQNFSSVRNTQDRRDLNRNVQGKSPTAAVGREIQYRPPAHGGPVKQKSSSVPEMVDVDQVMAAVRVPTMMNPVTKRKTNDMLAPRAEPVKYSSKHDQNITTAKHTNTTFYALNNYESQKNSSEELLEWFGPEFDDLLERWSEESSSSGRRTGSESSSAADPYSPNSVNSDISDNGAAIEDVFYEQLMRFSSSTSSCPSVNRSYTKDSHTDSQQNNSNYGIEFFLPGGCTENTGVLWTNKAT